MIITKNHKPNQTKKPKHTHTQNTTKQSKKETKWETNNKKKIKDRRNTLWEIDKLETDDWCMQVITGAFFWKQK